MWRSALLEKKAAAALSIINHRLVSQLKYARNVNLKSSNQLAQSVKAM